MSDFNKSIFDDDAEVALASDAVSYDQRLREKMGINSTYINSPYARRSAAPSAASAVSVSAGQSVSVMKEPAPSRIEAPTGAVPVDGQAASVEDDLQDVSVPDMPGNVLPLDPDDYVDVIDDEEAFAEEFEDFSNARDEDPYASMDEPDEYEEDWRDGVIEDDTEDEVFEADASRQMTQVEADVIQDRFTEAHDLAEIKRAEEGVVPEPEKPVSKHGPGNVRRTSAKARAATAHGPVVSSKNSSKASEKPVKKKTGTKKANSAKDVSAILAMSADLDFSNTSASALKRFPSILVDRMREDLRVNVPKCKERDALVHVIDKMSRAAVIVMWSYLWGPITMSETIVELGLLSEPLAYLASMLPKDPAQTGLEEDKTEEHLTKLERKLERINDSLKTTSFFDACNMALQLGLLDNYRSFRTIGDIQMAGIEQKALDLSVLFNEHTASFNNRLHQRLGSPAAKRNRR